MDPLGIISLKWSYHFTPGKLTWLAGKPTMNEDVFPIEHGGFSTAMLVFRGVTNFMHLGCIFVPRKLIIVTSYQPQPVIRISEPSTVLLCVLHILQVVPGRAGGGSFKRKKNYIAKKEFAYRMCAR